MGGPKKTNAARMLDRVGIAYQLVEYKVDEEDLSAPHIAAAVGLPAEQVFKTLVARGDRTGVVLAVVPGNAELDLKALAAASGNKKAELAHLKDVFPLTGYIRGGVSPLGTRRPYPVYLDSSASHWPCISISAGVRGCQMMVAPADLVRATGAVEAPLAKEPVTQS